MSDDSDDRAGMPMLTAADLAADLHALGLRTGDIAMVHVGFRSVGSCIGGPESLVAALRKVLGPTGTLMVATDWFAPYLEDDLYDDEGRVPDAWKPHIPPFDPATSRCIRDVGIIPEWVRTAPGAMRSPNAGGSIAALGARAAWLTADQPLDYGYGPGSPLAKLVEADGRVVMIGAPWETITLLHHAEHLADVPGKRVLRFEVPYRAADGSTTWRMSEEYESSEAIVAGLPDDYFAEVLADFVAAGHGRQGKVGQADSLLVEAPAVTRFAIDWLERTAPLIASRG